jgi:hypothetical protein
MVFGVNYGLADGEADWNGRLTISTRAQEQNTTVTVTQDLEDTSATVDLSQSFRRGARALDAGASVQNFPFEDAGSQPSGATASLRYDSHRMEAATTQSFQDTGNGDDAAESLAGAATTYRGSYRFGAGLYLAGGTLAVGPPSRSSFAVLRTGDNLPADRLRVGSSTGTVRTQSGWLGPAVLTNLRPYAPQSVEVELSGVPADYDIGPTAYIVEPSYRSGTEIEFEGTTRSYARGRVLDGDGNPVTLRAADVVPVSGTAARVERRAEESRQTPSQTVFTDREGVFEAYRLAPGTYELRVRPRQGREGGTARFEVTPDAGRRVRLGALTLSGGSAADDDGEDGDEEETS